MSDNILQVLLLNADQHQMLCIFKNVKTLHFTLSQCSEVQPLAHRGVLLSHGHKQQNRHSSHTISSCRPTERREVKPARDACGDALAIGVQSPGHMVPGRPPATARALPTSHACTAAAPQPRAVNAICCVAGLTARLPPQRGACCTSK